MVSKTSLDISTKKAIIAPGLQKWLMLILLAVITFCVFYPSLSAYFVDYDDPTYLLNNDALKSFSNGWNWDAVIHFFSSGAIGNYTPLTTLTYAIEKTFFAPDTLSSPFIFHLDNLLLHIACTCCVYLLLMKMNLSKNVAFIGALLFGIHPMRVESVAWVTERKDVLYGFLFLLSLLSYSNYITVEKGKGKWYLLMILFFLFSGLAKVQAVTLPLCLILFDFYFKRNWSSPKILLLEKAPMWIGAILFGLINVYILTHQKIISPNDALVHHNTIEKIALAAYAYAVYVVKFVYPYQMLAYYAYPVKLSLIHYLCLVAVPLVAGWGIWRFQANRLIVVGVLFFTFNVVFMLQIVAAGSTYLADRYTYIAYIGLIFLVANVYRWISQKLPEYKRQISILLGLYIVLLCFITYNQSRVWQNSVALWQHYINERPDDYYGYFQLGGYYIDVLMYNLPDPFLDQDEPDFREKPVRYIDTALAKDALSNNSLPMNTAHLWINHGTAWEFLKMYDSCISDYSKALTIMPDMKEALEKRAWTYFYIRKYELAMQDFNKYLELDTTNSLAYYRRGLCEGNMNRLDDGMRDVNKAIQMNTTDPQYYITRSNLYKLLNMPDSMHIDALRAQQLGGQVPRMLLQ